MQRLFKIFNEPVEFKTKLSTLQYGRSILTYSVVTFVYSKEELYINKDSKDKTSLAYLKNCNNDELKKLCNSQTENDYQKLKNLIHKLHKIQIHLVTSLLPKLIEPKFKSLQQEYQKNLESGKEVEVKEAQFYIELLAKRKDSYHSLCQKIERHKLNPDVFQILSPTEIYDLTQMFSLYYELFQTFPGGIEELIIEDKPLSPENISPESNTQDLSSSLEIKRYT